MPKPVIHQSVQNCIYLMGNLDSGILIPLYDTGINVAANLTAFSINTLYI